MRDPDYVFERVKERALNHEAEKRRRSNRIQAAVAVVLWVAIVGITTGIYLSGRRGRQSAVGTMVTPTGTNGSPTISETPVSEPEDWGFLYEYWDAPPVGTFSVFAETWQEEEYLREIIQNNPNPNDYYHLEIRFYLSDKRLEEIFNGLNLSDETFEKWLYSAEYYEHLRGLYGSEIARIKGLGVQVLSEDSSLGILTALITRDQILKLAGSDQCGYRLQFAKESLSGLNGFTEAAPSPTPAPNEYVTVGDAQGKIDYSLRGTFPAKRVVGVYVSLTCDPQAAAKKLAIENPEMYDAYMWKLDCDARGVTPDDADKENLAWQGLKMVRKYQTELENEWKEEFFASHPEYSADGAEWDNNRLVMYVSCEEINKLAELEEVTLITKNTEPRFWVTAIGKYNGRTVYDYVR